MTDWASSRSVVRETATPSLVITKGASRLSNDGERAEDDADDFDDEPDDDQHEEDLQQVVDVEFGASARHGRR